MSRITLAIAIASLSVVPVSAQDNLFGNGGLTFGTPEQAGDITVSAKLVPVNAGAVDVQVTVVLPEQHYIYSTNPELSGASKLSVTPGAGAKVELDGPIRADREPKSVVDKYMGKLEKFYDKVTWTQRLRSTDGAIPSDFSVSGELTGMFCSGGDNGTCKPIRPAKKFTAAMPEGYVPSEDSPAATARPVAAAGSSIVIVPKMRLGRDMTEPPIKYTVSLLPQNAGPGDHVTLSIKADVTEPYHTYSITLNPEASAVPTEILIDRVSGAAPVWEAFKASKKPEIKQEAGETLEVHYGTVEWTQEYVISGDNVEIEGTIIFQVCNEVGCLPPGEAPFRIAADGPILSSPAAGNSDVAAADNAVEFGQGNKNAALVPFIISAIGFGFLALLTPCVFPMIPVTIAYFLKQGHERPGQTVKLAIIYCLGIVGAFTVLGLMLSIAFGPTAINQLANNRWLNLCFAAIFVVFALMLMGMFEVRVPAWLLTWSSKKQESGGIVGVLFMALTFTLVSFTCTFAFVGQLMVWAAQGNYLMPVIGMMAFSTAFASPFFFLALFPSLLAKMPKSGGWMNSVKVTMGLLELAIVTKFLSVADTGFSPTGTPQFLDYHLVMGSWIAVALVTGLYLLGMFRMPHDTPSDTIGPIRCMFSLGFFGLGAYIAVGLFSPQAPQGALWQQIVAFAPPQIDFAADEDGYYIDHDGLRYELDFDAAVQEASLSNTPLFLDFTGVNCINCRRMEEILAQDEFHSVLEDLVRAQLYVDEVPGVKTDPVEHDRILSRNHELQEEWFADVTIPAYVIATPDGKEILATFKGLDTSGVEFKQFLSAGLSRWDKLQSVSEPSTAAYLPSNMTTN